MRAAAAQGACGGMERPVSKEKRDGAGVDSRFESRGGKALAQGMETFAVREGGGLLGVGGAPLGSPERPRVGEGLPWKYPPWWTVQLPIGSQCGQQAGGQERRAVLTSCALMNPQQHAVPCDVRQLQRDDRTDPQTGGGGRHQEGAGFGVTGTGDEALEFLRAQDVWQRGPSRARGQGELAGSPAERSGREALESTGHLVAGTPRQVAFDQQLRPGGVELLRTEAVGCTAIKLGAAHHRSHRGLLGPWGQSLHLHGSDHLRSSWGHDGSFAWQGEADVDTPKGCPDGATRRHGWALPSTLGRARYQQASRG